MMVLTVDIGNTTTSIGYFDNKKMIKVESGQTSAIRPEYVLKFYRHVDGAIISSVVPDKNKDFEIAIKKLHNISPIFLSPTTKLPIKPGYRAVSQLGPDRIAAMVGAVSEAGVPVCVIDMGTATTIDVINDKKEHIGGIILPGVRTGFKALVNNTSLLPMVSLQRVSLLGRSTRECMMSGMFWGEIKRLEGLLQMIKKEVGENLKFIMTGGEGKFFAPELKIPYSPWLTLIGLNEIYHFIKGR